jgi:23S rRNA pseudouridine1911/1915/1917 synthase
MEKFTLGDIHLPQILAVEKDFLLLYKPPAMHSAPIKNSAAKTILEWCANQFPETADLSGRRAGEGGLLYRLDYETQGLMILARTGPGMEALLSLQKEGKIFKEYRALTSESKTTLPGFPEIFMAEKTGEYKIKSAFRPYGPGRKSVRPVTDIDGSKKELAFDRGGPYTTEILESRPLQRAIIFFRIRISKGFRHQIRCHLAWLGQPILNDALYGGESRGGLLGLRASSLSFADPFTGKDREYSIPRLELRDL